MEGPMRRFYAFQYETHYIWGATAAILVNFAERFVMTRLDPARHEWMTRTSDGAS